MKKEELIELRTELNETKLLLNQKSTEYNNLLDEIHELENSIDELDKSVHKVSINIDLYYWLTFFLIIFLKNYLFPQYSLFISKFGFSALWIGFFYFKSQNRKRLPKFKKKIEDLKETKDSLYDEVAELRSLVHTLSNQLDSATIIESECLEPVIEPCMTLIDNKNKSLSLTLNNIIK